MGIFRRNSNSPKKPRFNVKAWIDYERIVSGARAIFSPLSLFKIPQRRINTPQNLEQIMQRLHLTEKDIQDRIKEFLQLALLMLILTTCLLMYVLYLLIQQHFLSALVGAALSLVTLGMSFRYHFWYFQLKQRKLGCTFMEWLRIGVIGIKK